jgi:hypothetical protein
VLAGTPRGQRNNELNAKAFAMGTMVAAGWIGRNTVEGRLYDACAANGLVADDGVHAVRGTIGSGLDAGVRDPHAPLEDGRHNGENNNGDANRQTGKQEH